MCETFNYVRDLINKLELSVEQEILEEEVLIVSDLDRGISQMLIDCEDTVLVLEQLIMELPLSSTGGIYKRLLQINRELVYGAFVLDEEGNRVLYRNTLALENLDLNELESTINALGLGLAEYGQELLSFTGD